MTKGHGGVRLLLELVIPLGLYYGLRAAGVSIYLTLVVTAVLPLAVAIQGLVSRRVIDGLAVYVLTTLTLGTAVSLISGSVQLLLAKEGWMTGLTALWFLGSVRARRSLTFLLTRPMLEGRGRMPDLPWDQLWEQLPRFRRIWRVSSVMWGVGLLVDSGLRVAMAYELPPDQVPAVGTALYVGTAVVLIVVTNTYYVLSGMYDARSPLYEPLAGG